MVSSRFFIGSDDRALEKSLDEATNHSARETEHSALNMFRNLDRKGSAKAAEDTTLPTVHQNTITYTYL
jgi:hypothetical protein